jgi:ribosome-associated protein
MPPGGGLQGLSPAPYNRLPHHPKERRILDSTTLARLAFDALGDKLAADLIILDLRSVALFTDYFVVATAESERQLAAAAGAVVDKAREEAGVKPNHVEGNAASGWVLVDFGDVVVHVFDPTRREFYAIERMWDGAPLVARMA